MKAARKNAAKKAKGAMKMKILTAVCVMALLVIASAAWADAPKRVKFTWSGGEAVAELNASPSAESLWAMLPVTVDFKDFNGVERIAYTEKELSAEGAPERILTDCELLASAGLEPPLVVRTWEELVRRGVASGPAPVTVEGLVSLLCG